MNTAAARRGVRSRLRALWHWLRSPSPRTSVGALLLAGGAMGVVFWGGFNTFMEYSNTLEFCTSCHEMRDNAYEEYRKSAHFTNASGVRAICSDCHVPRDWTAKLLRKVRATNELFHKFAGSIDTPAKYEAKREALANRVWASMKASDSRECRNCHSYQAMDFHKQSTRAREKMEEGLKKGETCIDCHKGIAHRLPPRDD